MKASQAVAEVLRREGVEQVFCFPANKMIDTAAEVGIRPIVGRQERSVINMADAYSRISNGERIGVAMVQHGPGAEHAFGGVAQAYADSSSGCGPPSTPSRHSGRSRSGPPGSRPRRRRTSSCAVRSS
jgi:thiamine pyrophosphate-dependent acetolactate synthase large subunit-like protein